MNQGFRLLTAALICAPLSAAAQEAAPAAAAMPDPATVTVPDLAFKPTRRDIRNYDSYFYFSKPGIGYEKAFADIMECRSYSQVFQFMLQTPDFVPWGSEPYEADMSKQYGNAAFQFGLIGVGVFGFAMDIVSGYDKNSNMRRCMGYKGYKRYGTAYSVWRQIDKGKDEAPKIARLALIASGPAPLGEAVDP